MPPSAFASYLSIAPSSVEERIKKAIPGYYLSTVKGGSSSGILEDICAYTYDIYLVGHAKLPDAVVRSVLQAIWVNIDKLPQFHPGFGRMDQSPGRRSRSDNPLPSRRHSLF